MVDIFNLKIGDYITISKSLHLSRKKELTQCFCIEFRLPHWNRSDFLYIDKREQFITKMFYYLYSQMKTCYVCGLDNRPQRELIKEIIKFSPFNTIW